MAVRDLLASNPELLALVAVVARAALAWQRGLSWSEYRTAHGIKRWVFPVLQRRVPVLSWVNEKGGRSDAEYLGTEADRVRAVAKRLTAAGGHLHLVNSVKRRPDTHGDPLSMAHVVFRHTDGTQTEAFLFHNADATTDLYAHFEPDPTRPLAHLGGESQSDGDPRGVVSEALDRNA